MTDPHRLFCIFPSGETLLSRSKWWLGDAVAPPLGWSEEGVVAVTLAVEIVLLNQDAAEFGRGHGGIEVAVTMEVEGQ